MALPSVAALPSSAKPTTTLPGLGNVTIKQERPDEAEIRELAAKMVEANKAKMASNAARPVGQGGQMQQHIVQPGQPGIMNFLTRGPNGQNKISDKDKKSGAGADPDKKPPCDEDSVRGRFGWVTLGKCHIPFIFRYGEKYCAVRMVEMKLLNKYLNYLHSDIYSCTCIRSYYITDPEARLLNEVNVRHCESQFGREPFTSKDLVVRLQDAGEFYNFLDVCYNKLLLSSSNPKDKCGFIRINGESVVPYTVRDGFKYVPLFYFEGETDNLKLKAEKLEGWDLAYLKFCCKVQGIRNELFASETCSVISLSDIKSYFPPGTVFEDYWPSKVVDSQLLLASNKGSTAVTSAGMWTKQPGLPPTQQHSVVASTTLHHQVAPGNKVVTTLSQPAAQQRTAPLSAPVAPPVNMSAAAAVQAVCNGWAGLVGGQPAFQPGMVPQPGQVIRMSQPPISMHNALNNIAKYAIASITKDYWKRCCDHVKKLEDSYWETDGRLSDVIDSIIISGDGFSTDSDSGNNSDSDDSDNCDTNDGHWLKLKKLSAERCIGKNGEWEKSLEQKKISDDDDIKPFGSYMEMKRKAENRKDWRKLGLQ
ncbi:hypothetical protein ANN_13077 [Periplaneta americana]|uniref:Uncharacterized protein n=1 Tax=Periplaneta americana TaxID=6978 RepID=A0ABQ8TIE2_PERAM|nr:hypothetical protein ANN_13077 [Periplaneta americana]